MKARAVYFIKIVFLFLWKINFSFLNAAGVLIFVAIFYAVPKVRSLPTVHLKNEKLSLSTTSTFHRDLSYIKPFTALVRFNRKATKETETKIQAQKTSFFPLPLSLLKLF